MRWIVFFDGECAFCSRSIRLLVRIDRHDRVRLSPLQGELARSQGLMLGPDPARDTMVVVRQSDGAVFERSDGWLELMRALGFPFNLLYTFKLVPRSVRDGIYRWVARNRYRWFQSETCELPDPEVVWRLLK